MPLPPELRLGPYLVTSPLGAGGMGEVYRATDTKLGRDVAIKLLPEAFSTDPERLARFEREAKLLASLNHPNVAHVYGFEKATLADGSSAHFLAMELVPGEDLAERLKRGAIPVDEAIAIAKQIAEALEEAHEKGIVHRDLKPANVKLTPDGKVKVLDFGLARVWEGPGAASSDLSQSPTLAHAGTAAGLVLGTAAYMSPEQARGKTVDKRADIWAFGVVLFEMLAGRRLFEGETVSDLLASVLKTAPDFTALPAGVPPRVRRLLGRCLRKDPKQRLHDIADARIELTDEEEPAPAAPAVAPPRRASSLVPWGVAALAIAAAAAWTLLGGHKQPASVPALKLAVLPPSGTLSSGPIDISPDGRQIVFTATGADGQTRLYVRSLGDLEARVLPGGEGADAPFLSPDGRSVAFFAEKKLKRVDLAGGPARELAEAPDPRGGSWGSQNLIVFAPEGGGRIFSVPAAGGNATPVTTLDPGTKETSHRWPRFLADGKRFLFMSRKPNPPGRLAVEVGSVEGGQRTRLVESSTGGVVARGRLYFVRETTLLAQAFDSRTLTVEGDPVPVAEGVWRNMNTDGLTAFSVAEDGTLAYRGGGLLKGQLTWLDRQGRPLAALGPPGLLGAMDLSPDDRHVLVETVDLVRDTSALFVVDGTTGMTTRVTFGTGNQSPGVYSPDGRQFAFSWDAQGPFDLYRLEVGSAGEPAPLLVSGVWKYPESWSPDGRFLSYTQNEPGQPRDIWVLPMTGAAKPFPVAQTPAQESGSAFSPDGRFLAYVSDESGRSEVIVRTFPVSTRKWQVSTGGGTAPVWRRDGKELFYLSLDLTLIAVPTARSARGLELGTARALFRKQGMALPSSPGSSPYAAASDGQRFLTILTVGEAESSPIVLQTGARR